MTDLLEISLLGGVRLTLGGVSFTGLASRRTEALLIYLVCSGQPHGREALADLLWDGRSQSQALGNLRVLLTSLRQTLGPYVTITRETVAFKRDSHHWLDVAALEAGLTAARAQRLPSGTLTATGVSRLAESLNLYRGNFLEGFYLRGSRNFEEWQVTERERLRLKAIEATHQAVAGYLALGDYQAGLEQARQLLQLDPLREEAHRQLMRLLACLGQRNAALLQYETCRQILADELAVEPMLETTALYEQIRAGQLGLQASQAQVQKLSSPPEFPQPLPITSVVPPTTFVVREKELTRLHEFLDIALTGQGRVVFITGEAGSGKSALAYEFARQAQETQPNLVVASGNCNAYTGLGDPYLPFREILSLLTGDIEAKAAAGSITPANASRLWALMPASASLLAEIGPALVGNFVPGPVLVSRARACGAVEASWLVQLEQLTTRFVGSQDTAHMPQGNLFDQYTAVLQALALRQPLLLLLDDLHWADPSSLSLLFHLGRRISGSRILLVGTYRPEDIAMERGNAAHPLLEVIGEFKREFGDIGVDLDQTGELDSRRFVEALLDIRWAPNRLDETFRQVLFQHTGGQPLFTIELLRDMQERGDLQLDAQGQWVAGPSLLWTRLPARVEGVIERRIGRLPTDLQRALQVASVEGQEFTAEVVARVQAVDDHELIRRLSADLVRQHRLLSIPNLAWVGQQPLSRYRFRHHLFQEYLYQTLDEVERAYLHKAVGQTLEALYGEQAEQIAGQLARHFQAAGMESRALDYLHQAEEQARRLSANQEATS